MGTLKNYANSTAVETALDKGVQGYDKAVKNETDILSVKDDLTGLIHNTLGLNTDIMSVSDFEIGSFTGTGEETDSITRIRSGFVCIDGHKTIKATAKSGYELQICTYTKDKNQIKPENVSDIWAWKTNVSINNDGSFSYIRLTIRKTDDSEISLSESVNITASFENALTTEIGEIKSDVLSVEEDLNQLSNNVLGLNDNILKLTTAENGSVEGTGTPIESTTRIRTGYIRVSGMKSFKINVTVGYVAQVCTYNKNRERFVLSTGVTWDWLSVSEKEYEVTDEYSYIRIILKRSDEAEISPSEITNVSATFNSRSLDMLSDVTQLTEKTEVINVATLGNETDLVQHVTFVSGSLEGTGIPTESTTRIRTESFVDVSQMSKITLTADSGYQCQLCTFTKAKTRIVIGSDTWAWRNKVSVDVTDDFAFIKVIVRKTNDSEISISEISNIHSEFISKLMTVMKANNDELNAKIDSVGAKINRTERSLNLTWEIGGFYRNLGDSPIDYRLRTQILTGLNGCFLTIDCNAGFKYSIGGIFYDNKTFRGRHIIKVTSDKIRISVGFDDDRTMTVADFESTGLNIRCYNPRIKTSEYDFIVASSESTDEEKAMADLVCDGVNDEEEIEYAINYNLYTSHICKVLLLSGTYYIDSFSARKSDGMGTEIVAQYALMCGNYYQNDSEIGQYTYKVEISGKYATEHRLDNSATILKVTDNAIQTLSAEKDNVLIGSTRAGSEKMGLLMGLFSLSVQNLMIYTNGAENRIVAIDGSGSSQLNVENCDIWAVESTADVPFDTLTIPDGSIGIRGTHGSCWGVKQHLKGNRIVGYKEGIALLGEHFIVQDNLQHHCYYGFTVGNYDVREAMEHPNVFIGNSVEQCYRMGLLNRYGATEESTAEWAVQTLIYIGGSIEGTWRDSNNVARAMLPIKEVVKGTYKGRIESDHLELRNADGSYNSALKTLFEDDGSGSRMEQTIW